MKKTMMMLAATVLTGALSVPAMAQSSDITAGELAKFNNYLNNHPEAAQQLSANPQLVNDPTFVNGHPGLKTFLENHPGVRQQLHEHPGQFMSREGRYEWQSGGGPIATAPGGYGGAVQHFDNGYLDQHPDVAHQLASDPRLVDNPQYLATHPGLDQYLANHPDVRRDLQQHPERFMNAEQRYERATDRGPGAVTRFDNGYLDSHPDVARQLGANPKLADNPEFLATHPGLDQYLANHPDVRRDLQQHPERFMNAEQRYDRATDRGPGAVAHFDNGYLDSHPDVARQLGRDPKLVDNPQFLATHPGLDQYLANHPEVRRDLQRHPERFINAEERYDRRSDNGVAGDVYAEEGNAHPFRNTDNYFDNHPEVENELRHNPKLINNSDYVDKHPGLGKFLENHPNAEERWKAHPAKFMRHEERYQKKHPNE